MTLASFRQPLIYPGFMTNINTAPGVFTLATLDAAGEYVATIFEAAEDITAAVVAFKPGTVVGGCVLDVRIETVAADGFPSGTLWDTNTNGSTGALTTNTLNLTTLTASATIPKGSIFCVKFAYSSGTSAIIQYATAAQYGTTTMPYQVVNTGTPTKARNIQAMPFAIGSSATSFYSLPLTLPPCSTNPAASAYNNTNGQARGLLFSPPVACDCVGAQWFANGAVGDFNMLLLDSTGATTHLSKAIDGNHNAELATGIVRYMFDSAYALVAGASYILAIEPTTTTNTSLYLHNINSTDYAGALPWGANGKYIARSSGTWTETATQMPYMEILINNFVVAEGGGGSFSAFAA